MTRDVAQSGKHNIAASATNRYAAATIVSTVRSIGAEAIRRGTARLASKIKEKNTRIHTSSPLHRPQ